ncbi:M48 family metallopeptidase [Desulfobacterales bacterium HSG16]|nr:M48 family metallopeptidase [Desulfobacterales bacterium HSG16]
MNAIAMIILCAVLIYFFVDMAADILNIRGLSKEVPENFSDVYDAKRYEKSQAYLITNTQFGWVISVFDLILFLVFWFLGGFGWLDKLVRSITEISVFQGLLFIGSLVFVKSVLSLPFSIYSTFVIEEKFGFNKTTWPTFVLDLVKVFALSTILGGIVISAILVFFEYAGDNGWWLCWLAVTLFMLAVRYIAPTWIMPLFNKFTPIEEGELKDAIMEYAKAVDFPVANVFVIDGSRRSEKSNAYFTGFGKNRRIALYDTLIEKHTTEELVAILAHEIGHYKHRHILYNTIIGIVHMGVIFFLVSFFISYKGLFDAFYVNETSAYAGLIFFGMLFSPIDFFISIFMQMFSRKNEYQADRFAVRTIKNPQVLADTLKKLSANNLSNLSPHPFYVFLNYSHPPLLERIRAINS